MAHNLEIKADGTASMFSGEGITPWHGLGPVIKGLATAEEALKLAGLDWDVEMIQCTKTFNGKLVEIPNRFSTTRMTDGKDFGIVSDDYEVYNNRDAFAFLNKVTDQNSGEALISTAGSLLGGARSFITLKLTNAFTVRGDDAHDLYLTATNSHDGNQAFTVYATPIRAVCENTVHLGLARARSKWTLKHRVPLDQQAAVAREVLEMGFNYETEFQKEVDKLCDISVTTDKFFEIVDELIPAGKRSHDTAVEEVMAIWKNEPTVQMGAGGKNAWTAFNSLTYWTDHKEYKTAESRFKAIIGTGTNMGLAERLRPKAHKMLLALG
jgi:phage/plasmid-like protein (TIGR03299 family)